MRFITTNAVRFSVPAARDTYEQQQERKRERKKEESAETGKERRPRDFWISEYYNDRRARYWERHQHETSLHLIFYLHF